MKLFIVFIWLGCIVLSCSDKETEEYIPLPLTMQFTITGMPVQGDRDRQFSGNAAIGLYMCNRIQRERAAVLTDCRGNWMDNVKLTVDDKQQWGSNFPLTWKDQSAVADVYAYYPWKVLSGEERVNMWPLKVAADQSQLDSLRESDFLWGKADSVSWNRATGRLELLLQHRTARLLVCVNRPAGTENLKVESLSFRKLYTCGGINLNNGRVSTKTTGLQPVKPYLSSDFPYVAEILVVPQTVEAGRLFSAVLNESGKLKNYTYMLDAPVELEAGKQYKLVILE